MVTAGEQVGLLHDEREKEDVPIVLRAGRATRSDLDQLEALRLSAGGGAMVPVGEIVRRETTTEDRSIYHKNLLPVVYVTADVAGAIESPVYAIPALSPDIAVEQHTASQPSSTERAAMKWDGEWHITYEVFRDLGLAFAIVLVLIYILRTPAQWQVTTANWPRKARRSSAVRELGLMPSRQPDQPR